MSSGWVIKTTILGPKNARAVGLYTVPYSKAFETTSNDKNKKLDKIKT